MRKSLFVMSTLFAATAVSAAAHASNSLFTSLGEGVYLGDRALRGPVSLEVVPSLGRRNLNLDLGLYATLENIEAANRDFYLRPGARVFFGPYFFARAGIPLRITNGIDWGLLLGAGGQIPLNELLSLFLAVDAFSMYKEDFKTFPLEGRFGLAFRF